MNTRTLVACSLMIISLAVFLTGCTKETLPPVATEVSQPQPSTQPGTTAEEPTMQMGQMGSGAESAAQGEKAAAGDARSAFENTDVFFEYDSFDLSAEAKKVLAEKASFLNNRPKVKVSIEGHCDERGTQEYNLALGERRAKAAWDYLVFLGVDKQRLTTISYGEERPIDPGKTEEAYAKNRRAHFAITGE